MKRRSVVSKFFVGGGVVALVGCSEGELEFVEGETSETGQAVQPESNAPSADVKRRPRPTTDFPDCDDSIDCCPAGFERVEGTSGDDNLDGIFTVASCLVGFDGDDDLDASSPGNILLGGPGVDDIKGGFGKDIVLGGDGNDDIRTIHDDDEIDAGPGDDEIDGGFGDDVIFGREGNDDIDGGDDEDWISAGPGDDVVEGGFDADHIEGNAGDDEIEGGIGDDTIIPGPGRDEVDGGIGDDTVIIYDECELEDGEVLDGGFAGNDTLIIPVDLATVQGMGVVVTDFENIIENALQQDESECRACGCVGGECCSGNGDCVPNGNQGHCDCNDGFFGVACAVEAGDCVDASPLPPHCPPGVCPEDLAVDRRFNRICSVSYTCPTSYTTEGGEVQAGDNPATMWFPARASAVGFDDVDSQIFDDEFPLVVVSHGTGQKYDTGYDYLLRHLAHNGYIATSVETNPFGVNDTEKHVTRAELLRQFLECLRKDYDPNDVDFEFFDAVQRHATLETALVGHSSGGEGAIEFAERNAVENLAHNIQAVVALTPDHNDGGANRPQTEDLCDPATEGLLVITSSRDSDTEGDGTSIYDRASTETAGALACGPDDDIESDWAPSTKSMLWIDRARHNGFHEEPLADAGERFPVPPPSYPVMSDEAHREILKTYVLAFLRWHIPGVDEYREHFDGRSTSATLLSSDCPEGSAGCACVPNTDQCSPPLECVAGNCVEAVGSGCAPGDRACSCAAGTCAEGLDCVNDACVGPFPVRIYTQLREGAYRLEAPAARVVDDFERNPASCPTQGSDACWRFSAIGGDAAPRVSSTFDSGQIQEGELEFTNSDNGRSFPWSRTRGLILQWLSGELPRLDFELPTQHHPHGATDGWEDPSDPGANGDLTNFTHISFRVGQLFGENGNTVPSEADGFSTNRRDFKVRLTDSWGNLRTFSTADIQQIEPSTFGTPNPTHGEIPHPDPIFGDEWRRSGHLRTVRVPIGAFCDPTRPGDEVLIDSVSDLSFFFGGPTSQSGAIAIDSIEFVRSPYEAPAQSRCGPDVAIRDFVGIEFDGVTVPGLVSQFESGSILFLQEGQPSPPDGTPTFQLKEDTDHTVYLRVENIGVSPAEVRAKLFTVDVTDDAPFLEYVYTRNAAGDAAAFSEPLGVVQPGEEEILGPIVNVENGEEVVVRSELAGFDRYRKVFVVVLEGTDLTQEHANHVDSPAVRKLEDFARNGDASDLPRLVSADNNIATLAPEYVE